MRSKHSQFKIYFRILMTGLVLLLAGCQSADQKNDPTPDLKPIEVGTPEKTKPAPLVVKIVPRPSPNQYEIKLLWPIASHTGTWLLERAENSEPSKPLATIAGHTQEFLDTSVKPGGNYVYALTGWDGQTAGVKHQISVTIPRDLEIRSTARLSSIRDVARLFLSSGAKLYPATENMVISVDELISDGGSIETIPEGKGGTTFHGKAGGVIKIRALRGSGKITVIARGENGAEGLVGAGPPAQTVGAKGGDGGNGGNGGNSGRIHFRLATPSPLSIDIQRRPGAPGKGGPGALGSTYFSIPSPRGNNGTEGLPGKEEPFCLEIGETTYGDCEALKVLEGSGDVW